MDNKKLIVERGASFHSNEESGEVTAFSCEGARKLGSVDWETPLTGGLLHSDIFEVRFKNTRKGYYINVNNIPLKEGDIVAVESSPGHDIGIISLTGNMVRKQMRCKRFNPEGVEFKKIYRIAKDGDIVKWQEAIALEHRTMIRARQIADQLGLNMKIGDVEYQGDRVKAIFYYIADARVDFRELIKVFAEEFRIRIEMKQIGARQEAGRIGGIGSCGRQLCCSTWVTNFVSVTTNSARFQEISLNPQKLAGQCGKLKCCLNYEVDSYIDVRKTFPKVKAPLETKDALYYLVKTDILKQEMLFSSDEHSMINVITIPVGRVREIMSLNRKGIKVDTLQDERNVVAKKVEYDFTSAVGDDSITRFDKSSKDNKRRRNKPLKGRKPDSEEVKATDSRDNRNNRRSDNPRNGNREPQENTQQQQQQQQQQRSEKPKEEANKRSEQRSGRSNNRRRYNNRPKGGSDSSGGSPAAE